MVTAMAWGLAGCAVSYVNDEGAQRIVGLAEVEVLPADTFVHRDTPETPSRALVGDVATVRVIGVLLMDSEDSSAIAFGYAAQTSAFVRDCYDLTLAEPGLRGDCRVQTGTKADTGVASGTKAEYYLGFVDLTLLPPDRTLVAGSFATHQSFGLSLLAMGSERILSVGYHDSALVALDPDVFVADMPFHAVPRAEQGVGQ
jgi:hypothetical protein